MPGFVQRVGDANAGGGIIYTGDPTVLVNGRPIAVIGSAVTPHPPCPKSGIHCSARTLSADYSILVNGKPITTSGAIDTCGHARLTGSFDVIVGGAPK